MAGRRAHTRGITLLELLVAMSLMVVVASALYSALYTGFRAQRSASSAVYPTSQAMTAMELLKQDICGVLPPTGVLAGPFVGNDLRGNRGVDADSVEFYTTQIYASRNEIVGGIGKIELSLEEDLDDELFGDITHDTYKLVRRVTSNLLSPKVVDPNEQVLCRDVLSLNLRYYDGATYTWVDDWDSLEDANSLPLAMEIDIEVVDETRSRNMRASVTNATELPKRRLIQSFVLPVGLTALPEEEEEEATEEETEEPATGGGQTGGGQTGGGQTGGGQTGGGQTGR